MSITDIAARVAARATAKLFVAAEYTRKAGGDVVSTSVAINRGYAIAGHVGQRDLSIVIPLNDIAVAKAGDSVATVGVASERFDVIREIDRDDQFITVAVRALA